VWAEQFPVQIGDRNDALTYQRLTLFMQLFHTQPSQYQNIRRTESALSFLSVADAICGDGKHSFCFWQTWRAVDFADAGFPTSLP
jgi:hypothetical protein